MTLTVFGGFGFVGSEFCKQAPFDLIVNPRDNYTVRTQDVINFISTVHNYNVHTNPHLDINTNLSVLIDTLEGWRKSGGKGCYTLISSWFVYGKDSGYGFGSYGIEETESCDPKGFYSITKRCAEQLLISYCETFDLNYRILRLANVLGKDDKKVSAQKNALQYLLGQIRENKPIELYDSGNFYRDYIDSRDCARAIILALEKGEVNTVYNIGNGIPIRFRDVIDYAKNRLNSTSEIQIIEQKEFHKKVQSSRSFYMNNDRLKSLGYAPKYNVYQSIDDILQVKK